MFLAEMVGICTLFVLGGEFQKGCRGKRPIYLLTIIAVDYRVGTYCSNINFNRRWKEQGSPEVQIGGGWSSDSVTELMLKSEEKQGDGQRLCGQAMSTR